MDIVVSTVNVPGCGWGYVTPAIYEAKTGKNGKSTYRRVVLPLGTMTAKSNRDYPVGFRSAKKAEEEGRKVAAEYGVPFVSGIRHGSPVPA